MHIEKEKDDFVNRSDISKYISDLKTIELKLHKKNTELLRANLLLTESSRKTKLERKIGDIFTVSENLTVLFLRLFNLIKKSFLCEYGFLGYVNRDEKLICPAFVSINFENVGEKQKKIELENFDKGWNSAFDSKKTVFYNNENQDIAECVAIRNFVSLVIKESEKGSVIGFLTLVNKSGGFTGKDIKEIEELCDYISPLFMASLKNKNTLEELQLAKEKAENSDNLKTVFLRNISHEIRTPISSILGFSEFVFDEDYDINERQLYLNRVKDGVNKLKEIVDSIVLISSLQTGECVITKSSFNVNDVILKLKTDYEFLADDSVEKKINFICEFIESNDIYLNSDYLNILYIIRILLNNAFKFTQSGYVKLSVKNNEKFIIYQVEDTGIGILEEEKCIIMGLFTQANEFVRSSYGGLGLGLPIAAGLLKLLDGSLTIDSEKGKGTKINVSFPVKEVKKEKLRKYEGSMDLVVLLAGYDEFDFVYINELLSHCNVKVLRAENGRESLTILEKTRIDVLLMDLENISKDGFNVVCEIREINKEIPIVGQVDSAFSKTKYSAAGFTDVLINPFSESKLKGILCKYIKID